MAHRIVLAVLSVNHARHAGEARRANGVEKRGPIVRMNDIDPLRAKERGEPPDDAPVPARLLSHLVDRDLRRKERLHVVPLMTHADDHRAEPRGIEPVHEFHDAVLHAGERQDIHDVSDSKGKRGGLLGGTRLAHGCRVPTGADERQLSRGLSLLRNLA